MFFNSLAKVKVLISVFTFFQFYSVVCRDSKVDNFADFLFLLIIIRCGLLAEIRWSDYIFKSHRSLYVTFSRTGAGLCIYHLSVWIIIIPIIIKFSLIIAFFTSIFESGFHLVLRDGKSLQVSTILLKIPADPYNTLLWMVWKIALISIFSNLLSNSLRNFPNTSTTISITIILMFNIFLVLWQGPSVYFYFLFHLFLHCGVPEWQNLLDGKFSFCFNEH